MRAFVTGSHAYGKPNEKSDIDLVVLLSPADKKRLIKAGALVQDNDNYKPEDCSSMRFGKLNLICCDTAKQYTAWLEGTTELKNRAPVSRDDAIEYFLKKRMAEGFYKGKKLHHEDKP